MSTHSLGNDSHFLEFFLQFLSVDAFAGVINNLLSEMSNPGEIVANSSQGERWLFIIRGKRAVFHSDIPTVINFGIQMNIRVSGCYYSYLSCFCRITWSGRRVWFMESIGNVLNISFDNTIPPRRLCWNCDQLEEYFIFIKLLVYQVFVILKSCWGIKV